MKNYIVKSIIETLGIVSFVALCLSAIYLFFTWMSAFGFVPMIVVGVGFYVAFIFAITLVENRHEKLMQEKYNA